MTRATVSQLRALWKEPSLFVGNPTINDNTMLVYLYHSTNSSYSYNTVSDWEKIWKAYGSIEATDPQMEAFLGNTSGSGMLPSGGGNTSGSGTLPSGGGNTELPRILPTTKKTNWLMWSLLGVLAYVIVKKSKK